jgi:hypothetical protein
MFRLASVFIFSVAFCGISHAQNLDSHKKTIEDAFDPVENIGTFKSDCIMEIESMYSEENSIVDFANVDPNRSGIDASEGFLLFYENNANTFPDKNISVISDYRDENAKSKYIANVKNSIVALSENCR